jgi:hypothetical protein
LISVVFPAPLFPSRAVISREAKLREKPVIIGRVFLWPSFS